MVDEQDGEWQQEETAALDFSAGAIEADEGRQARLVVQGGSRRGETIVIRDGLTIGRGADADFQVQDDGVSRVHVKLVMQPDGAFGIVDLGSRNGTLINGQRMASALLQDGDTVLIGAGTLFKHCAPGSTDPEPVEPLAGSDRRAHERAGLVMKIHYPTVDDFVEDYTLNISHGGMRICTDQQLAVGDMLEMVLSFPTLAEPLRVTGAVRWVRHDDQTGENTAGVKLERWDSASQSAFEDLVDRALSEAASQRRIRAIRVLVADDNAHVVELIRRGLEQQRRRQPDQGVEFETVQAADGNEALRRLAAEKFDLLMVERSLPLVDGEALIREVRERGIFDGIITAVGRQQGAVADRLLEAGADFYLRKPFRLLDVIYTMQSLLGPLNDDPNNKS